MRAFCLILSLCIPFAAFAQSGDPVEDFSRNDPAMNAAMATANETLDQFLANATAQGLGLPGTSVKVAFDVEGRGAEIIWVGPFAWDGGSGFAGLLANQPNFMDNLNAGDRVDFDRSMIRDWAVSGSDGLLYGHYTTRVIAARLDRTQREGLEAILSPNPIPGGW